MARHTLEPRADHRQLQKHSKTECPVCGQKLSRSGDVNRHARTHLEGEEKAKASYTCTVLGCEYSTFQRPNLITHLKTHSKIKDLPCPDCEFATGDPGSLTRHRKRHHGYVPPLRRKTVYVGKRKGPCKPNVASEVNSNTNVDMRSLPYRSDATTSSPFTSPSSTVSDLPYMYPSHSPISSTQSLVGDPIASPSRPVIPLPGIAELFPELEHWGRESVSPRHSPRQQSGHIFYHSQEGQGYNYDGYRRTF